MRTDVVSSLRQRMIEDMNARKLGSHTQRSHVLSCKRFAAFFKRSPDTATAEDIRQFQLHFADECEHLQPQPHHDWAAVPVSRDAAATGSCGRDLSHPRAPRRSRW